MSLIFSSLGAILLIVLVLLFYKSTHKVYSVNKSETQWALAKKEFQKKRLNKIGLYFIFSMFAVAFTADFLASDLPILLYKDKTFWVLPNIFHPPQLITTNNTKMLSGELLKGEWAIMPVVPYGPLEDLGQLGTKSTQEPNILHPLGTDDRGRDIASRMIHGTRVTLTVGVLAVSLYVLIGIILGSLAGYLGGWWDILIGRATEIFMSFPSLFLILTIQAILPTTAGLISVLQLVLVIGITGWTEVSRLVRAEVIRTSLNDYVSAAKAAGLSNTRILVKYVLPNSMGPVLVAATFGIAGAVLMESALSFLGFGVQPPMASWGEILQQARQSRRGWMVLYPGLAVFLSVTAYNLAGEGLRDALDPKMRSNQ